MPKISAQSLEKIMRQHNMLFKHQLANYVGLSYSRLSEIVAEDGGEVDEETLERLCASLKCTRADLVE